MTRKNQIPKENFPKIEEVRYWDYEIKTSKLSPSARSKIVKKYGADYVSENKEGYGPGSTQSSYSDNSDETKRKRHAGKVVTGMVSTVTSKAATPVFPTVLGVATSLVGEVGHALSSGDGDKDAWKYISELGQDMVFGSAMGSAVDSLQLPNLLKKGRDLWQEFEEKGGKDKLMIGYHDYHTNKGESYSSWCDVCKS